MPPLPGLPAGIIAQVKPHLTKTTGFVLAGSADCLEIRDREIRTIQNRVFIALGAEDLAKLPLPPSWLLGVIVCPGDDTQKVAEWAVSLPLEDRSRIRFYFHSRAPQGSAMQAWSTLGLGPVQYDTIESWQQFHQRYGADHAIRVFQDHVHQRR